MLNEFRTFLINKGLWMEFIYNCTYYGYYPSFNDLPDNLTKENYIKSFKWDASQQGFKFWYNVHKEWELLSCLCLN